MLFLVATDANDGLGVIAINLSQTVDEYDTSKFTLAPAPAVYPGVQMHASSLVFAIPSVIVFTTHSVQACAPVSSRCLVRIRGARCTRSAVRTGVSRDARAVREPVALHW